MTKTLDYMNVPIDLCIYALEYKKVNEVRLYLYLKSISDGYIKAKDNRLNQAVEELDICGKTLKKHLKWLLIEGWLIYNDNHTGIRIIGYEHLYKNLGFKIVRGALLYKAEIKNFKNFAIASVIQFEARGLQWRNRQAGLMKRSPELAEVPSYPLLPHNYLAKILSKSKSTVARYRKQAQKNHYLKTRKRMNNLEFPGGELDCLKKHGPYKPECLRKKGSRVYYQLPDEIQTIILIRRKNELRKICHENREKEKSGT